ncbi:MAG: VanZ family protein, partial [Kiritimatiellia bacterium]|nr:VanZ family protein [Kiritimatiellia bacterium]
SNHGVCSGTGSGSETFTQVFTIPDRAMTVRFELQHLGVAGRMGIESFSVQQVDLRRSTRWVFGGLIGIWFFLAVWSVRKLRLFRRPWGRAVFISAFLIAVGMLLPGRILGDAKSQVADWVQPAAPPATPPPAVDQSDPAPAPVAPLPPTAIQTARLRVEQLIRRIDPHLWGHLSFFFLLGVTCGLCFLPKAPPRGLLLRVLLGGLLYSVAAELLQVAELSRSVRIGDVGLNLLGFVVGLAFLCVAAPAAAEFLTETRRARRSLGG